ncbi:UDP-glycosyltransferase [Heracleum sosnowskyi]|uniref:UDP-glycosyltransferase n=1 Tax=Heracleum sosnowskyi TaxID=360622 RepID=A0AAD8GY80_9APIA|nr:UDP-glycosyltransferase [Heracleum sosnowskyi]
MEMGKMDRDLACKTHVMMIPFPAQGHMSPMMQFSKRLAFKGVKVTMIVPLKLQDSMQLLYDSPLINLECITYDFNEDEIPTDMHSYMGFIKLKITSVLTELLEKQKSNGCPVKLLVIDSLFPSGVEMCHQFGLRGAPFFTQSCAVNAIYLNVFQGELKIPFEKGSSKISLPSLPLLDTSDLPSNVIGTFPDLWTYFSKQFSDLDKADWIFINSFDTLENEEVKWFSGHCPLTTVGPAIPSMYLDERLPNDKQYGITLSLGVPMVAVPVWFDQPTNGKYIVDVWRVGVRVPVDESGMVSRDEVAACIMDAMEGDQKEEIRENALKWKRLAIEAMNEGGSSDQNICDFITELVSS